MANGNEILAARFPRVPTKPTLALIKALLWTHSRTWSTLPGTGAKRTRFGHGNVACNRDRDGPDLKPRPVLGRGERQGGRLGKRGCYVPISNPCHTVAKIHVSRNGRRPGHCVCVFDPGHLNRAFHRSTVGPFRTRPIYGLAMVNRTALPSWSVPSPAPPSSPNR